MAYAIQNANGQWWTGTCWGVKQAREEYGTIADVPDCIDNTPWGDGDLEAYEDYFYPVTADDEDDNGPVAKVRKVD